MVPGADASLSERSEQILAGFRLGVEAWPGVTIPEADFIAYVDHRWPPAEGSVGGVHWADLYLACGCARGDTVAVASFEAAFGGDIDRAVRRVAARDSSEDVGQVVLHRLVFGEAGLEPKISAYTGRGELRAWVRISASRTALNSSLRASRERPFEADTLTFLVGTGEDPEIAYFKRMYSEQFRLAFAEAFAALESRERTLVRYAFGDALTVDAVGAIYNVHRATAARWIAKAHTSLLTGLRSALVRRLGVEKKELASILRLIESQFDMSLHRYLGPDVAV